MGIFDKIKSAIWGEDDPDSAPSGSPAKPVVTASASAAGTKAARPATPASAAPSPAAAPASARSAPQPTSSAAARSASAAEPVDVSVMLDGIVRKKGQKLDWRRSIVDLMKALDLDSSLSNRKELARELGYQGNTGDSAAMNMWLHKAVMRKLAESGGRVPSDLIA